MKTNALGSSLENRDDRILQNHVMERLENKIMVRI